MAADGTIALSALVLGIVLSGIVAGSITSDRRDGRRWMIIAFAALGMIASVPLSAAFMRPLYLFHMPTTLPGLMLLPVAIQGYVTRRTDPSASPPPWRHFILPGSGLITTLGFWLLPTDMKSTLFVQGQLPPGLWPATLALMTFSLIILWCFVSLAHLISASRSLRRHRARLKTFYSNTERLELRWIDGFMYLLIILWLSAAITLLSDNLGSGAVISGDVTLILTAITLLIFMGYAIGPTADIQPPELMSDPSALTEQTPLTLPVKYSRSALSDTHAQRIAARIESAMAQEHLYLDPNLSLRKLSTSVQSPQNLVSQTLNMRLETTFFDYVARWRIDAAKPLVEDGKLSIHDIALQVGFNTRSTFYKAFRNETGMTPTAYRRTKASAPKP